jgi:ribose 5-phosphate isomerase A
MEKDAPNGKKTAAVKAIEYIHSGMTLGLGTGSTAYWAIQAIGEMVKKGLQIRAVATSVQSDTLARELQIPMVEFSDIDHVDITIDGADEVNSQLDLIKGGGGALLREKIVAAATNFYIIIVDDSKLVDRLGKFPLPVEVAPFGWEMTMRRLGELGCKPQRRMAGAEPYLTDNNHYIVDCSFGQIDDPVRLHGQVNAITGVMENGLFVGMADLVAVGYPDGNAKVIVAKRSNS